MGENWPDQVVERLAQLEAENRLLHRKVRWMGWIGGTSLSGLLVAAAAGAAMQANPEITPGRIVIKDPGGTQNAIVLKANAGNASIEVWDVKGNRRVDLGATPTGQGLVLTDPQGQQNTLK
jgi:hypothetical protein